MERSGTSSRFATEAGSSRAVVPYEPYPPSALNPRGFIGTPVRETLQPGTVITRYGREGVTFVSPAGTPFSGRGLPPGFEAAGESSYVITAPIEVDAGIAAYWQGGGGGIQYEKYGDPLGPSYEDLVGAGKMPEQIISGAGRTNTWIDRLLGVG